MTTATVKTNAITAPTSQILNLLNSSANTQQAHRSTVCDDKLFTLSEEQQLAHILMQLRINLPLDPALAAVLTKNKQIDSPAFIPCYKGKQQYLMNVNDIEYIYSNSVTGVHIYTNEGEFHTSWTLKTFTENATFTRCHRQYLINKRYIKMIEKLDNGLGKSYTYNGHTIPVSRRYLSEM